MTDRHAIPSEDKRLTAPQYRVTIPTTGIILRSVADLSRAKAIAAFYCRQLAHPDYPPKVIVERVSADGKRRKVWEPDAIRRERGLPTGRDDLAIPEPTNREAYVADGLVAMAGALR